MALSTGESNSRIKNTYSEIKKEKHTKITTDGSQAQTL